ncbi:hypothetical protein G3480_06705 [Thiorhodococcus mannitoliphagus]|uniref:VPLPA-CTERM sorting domain-containing protein n=1 Tax=Thiorhodococcus mannitoliphagus TaxID=329406 RepID=A0A6P1DTI9_9GAMM|nr:VPLPA-CTERM sorting domain-containing protein [Thiorhodococcus mannitoliphagus]NEX20006.1 hypothetical protein [Thiorhodococcus mannitoliphagus]
MPTAHRRCRRHWGLFATDAEFQYGAGEAGITTANNRNVDANALGDTPDTFRSLGLEGAGVFEFGTDFTGPVTIWETTFNCTGSGVTCGNHPEQINVYAGNTWDGDFSGLDFNSWTSLGTIGNGTAQSGGTLDATGTFSFLLIVDNSTSLGSRSKDGFDVARVQVSAVPIPAAGLLFGPALLGLVGVARLRRKTGALQS